MADNHIRTLCLGGLSEKAHKFLICRIGLSREEERTVQGDVPRALIVPADLDRYTRFRPSVRRDISGCGEVLVETHYNLPASDFETPGNTHYMLFIRVDVNARLRYGWYGVRYDGTVRSGDLALVPAGVSARVQLVGQYARTVHVFFAPSFLAKIVEGEWNMDSAGLELVGIARFHDESILWLGRMLSDVANDMAPGGRLLLESLSTAAATLLLRSRSTLSVPRRAPAPRGGLAANSLARVLEYMRMHLAEDIGLYELAALAGCSPQHFKRVFKTSSGLPPYRFLSRLRVERAQTLLARGSLTLAEVGLASGFSNQSHFTTVFRNHTGVTPGRWRRSALN
jgi:AraC family transcriptional regulator